MVNEDGIKITTERYEHLRKQSDKSYIRIGNRMSKMDERTTNLIPQNSKVQNDVKHPGKELGPTIIDDLMGFENYMKTMRRKSETEMEIQSEDVDDVVKTQQSSYMHGRQKDCKQLLQKPTDERTANFTSHISKVSNNVQHTGNRLDSMMNDVLMGFENYMKTMLRKAEMETKSDNMNDAVKSRQSRCRHGKKCVQLLSKHWSRY